MIPTFEQVGMMINTGMQIRDVLGGAGGSEQGTTIPDALNEIAGAIEKLRTVIYEYPEEKDINFIDYDGTILHSYTKEEFAALSAMPANPEHEGLTARGWNWDFEDAKTSAAAGRKFCIGQLYVTDDGKTRYYIKIADDAVKSVKTSLSLSGTAVVDWGDGSEPETLTGSNYSFAETQLHTYPGAGDYVITIDITEGKARLVRQNSKDLLYTDEAAALGATYEFIYTGMIEKIEIGENISTQQNLLFEDCSSMKTITMPDGFFIAGPVSSLNGTFQNCYALQSVTIPEGVKKLNGQSFSGCTNMRLLSLPKSVTSFCDYEFNECPFRSIDLREFTADEYSSVVFANCRQLEECFLPESMTKIPSRMFENCESLESVDIPENVTTIESQAFSNCRSLKKITIPEDVTSVGSAAFANCYTLASVEIPENVATIGNNAFGSCYGLHEIHFKKSTPPTLGGSQVFYGLPAYCKIYVPTGSLSAYTSAQYYPNSSTYTYIEE